MGHNYICHNYTGHDYTGHDLMLLCIGPCCYLCCNIGIDISMVKACPEYRQRYGHSLGIGMPIV